MSVQITTAMVNQYSANVFHLSQQKGSRLRGAVSVVAQNAESAFYDRIGSVTAQKKVGRHADTTYTDTPHSRRRITLEDYFYADLVDQEDKLRIIQNPESEYAQAAIMALGRAMDDEIIAALLGTAYSGKSGGTSVVLADSQKVAAFDGATTDAVGLNVKTLRAVKKLFHQNETGDSPLFMAVSAEQIDDLLGETEVTSSDFAVIKALVAGDVNTFMGFNFIRTERLAALGTSITTMNETTGSITSGTRTMNVSTGTYRRCIAFQKEGIILAMSKEVQAKMDVLPEKHYATQIYACMGLGSTRIEDEKVVEVICKE